jgi:glycosyltransferase involved in cell wall biosynthesis
MKVLLVGPFPPPHGGVSVHVASVRQELMRQGVQCRIVNTDPRAPRSDQYFRVSGGMDLLRRTLVHAARGWLLHVHTNGHTLKGWLIALLCGMLSATGPGGLLTLHSGMTPAYLQGRRRRLLARIACSRYRRIICVSPAIRRAIERCGVSAQRLEVLPAYLACNVADDGCHAEWMQAHKPILSTVLAFRHEYGFDLLVEAVRQLRATHPNLGVVVIGGGDKSDARACIARAGLAGCMLLAGDVPHQSCLSIISRSDVFVRPTRADGDSISVREALALGKPVVASDVCVRPKEVVQFRSERPDELCAALAACLDGRARPRSARGLRHDAVAARLLDIYSHLGRSVHAARINKPAPKAGGMSGASRAWEG